VREGLKVAPSEVPFWDPLEARQRLVFSTNGTLRRQTLSAGLGTFVARRVVVVSTPPLFVRSSSTSLNRYVPRATQESELWAVLRDDVPEFLERTQGEDPEWRIPAFVEKQLRSLLTCGDVASGFLLAECERCDAPRVIPFS
jgi:hypothetical protein